MKGQDHSLYVYAGGEMSKYSVYRAHSTIGEAGHIHIHMSVGEMTSKDVPIHI